MRRERVVTGFVLVLVVADLAVSCRTSAAAGPGPVTRRLPSSLVLSHQRDEVYVGDRASGRVSIVRVSERRVVSEWEVARTISGLALVPSRSDVLLVLDEAVGRLHRLERQGERLIERDAVEVGFGPVAVQVAPRGRQAVVSLLWARRLVVVGLGPSMSVDHVVDVPFNPRHMTFLDENTVVVADAFNGRVALLNLPEGRVGPTRPIGGHNIGGLALAPDGQTLFLTHQVLSPAAKTTADDLHWGFLLVNGLRAIPVAALRDPESDLIVHGRLVHLGGPGRGAGDPGAIAIAPDGRTVIALCGVGEVAIGPPNRPDEHRLTVGARPATIALDSLGMRAMVVDPDEAELLVVDLVRNRVSDRIALGPRPEPGLVERGERLFHDARLSHEGWMSCQSCHTEGHTNNLVADTLGDGSYGAPKRVPSLLGCAETAPYGWDGRTADLREQIRKSAHTTMRGRALTEDEIAALEAYLRALRPPPSVSVARGQPGSVAQRGGNVFTEHRCDRCHEPPSWTSSGRFDVDLLDEHGQGRFNPPDLRGASQRDRFLHDGRAGSLGEVFRAYRHPTGEALAEPEVTRLIEFLLEL